MIHESNKTKELIIQKSTVTFEDIYKKEYFPKSLSEELKKANVLILPYENFRDFEEIIFPEETLKFYQFIKDKNPDSIISDICVLDTEYSELELHSDLTLLPTMILELAIFPIVVNVVSDYITSKILSRNKNEDTKVKAEFIVTNGDSSKIFKYEGDADKFKESFKEVKEFFDE